MLVLLSTFKSVTTCKLFSHHKSSLDLRPLSALPLLTRLALEGGRFSGLEAAAHLSSLVLQATEVVCAQECSCVTSLVELKLVFAKLYSFHSKNVAACLCLESLVLDSASIIGHTPVWSSLAFPDDEAPSIPSGMSAMTALTSLELRYPAHAMWFGWLTTLSALQSFTLTALQCQEALFPTSCSSLTSLKTMTVCLNPRSARSCNLVLEFDLGTLAALQRFELRDVSMHADRLSGLASLPNLQEVHLENVKPIDLVTATEMGLLAFELGRHRQAVQFRLCSHNS